jgi:hypothetical protein
MSRYGDQIKQAEIDAAEQDMRMRAEKAAGKPVTPPRCYNCSQKAAVTIGTGDAFIFACRRDYIGWFKRLAAGGAK